MNDPQVQALTPAERRWALSLITIAVAVFVGGAVGFAGGHAVASASAASCTPTDQWCELGAALTGGAIGIATGIVTYIVIGVASIRRHRPKGGRAGYIAVHLAAPVAAAVLLGVLGSIL